MQLFRQFLLVLFVLASSQLSRADVQIAQLADRFRIEIDGKLFTEWQMTAWRVPYLYPVIGPNGENITRHYPMRNDVEGESHDHPHHRGIRFSHRKVNGVSYWSPDKNSDGHTSSIAFERVEEIKSGDTGELVFWNRWLKNGELLMREKVHLTFQPLPDGEVLMDYDTHLFTQEIPVIFEDEKDGGLGIRVAATMAVENRKSKARNGTIVNSNGLENAAAWGKRAEWCDYYGPDAAGKIVGVAIFDHPANLRFPTHWHARDYGLMTANRFGKGMFEKRAGATPGEGDYTIAPNKTLILKHRFFFHHGDARSADVAGKYAAYIAED